VTDPALPAKPRARKPAATPSAAAKPATNRRAATKTTAKATTKTTAKATTKSVAPSADGLPRRGAPAPKPDRVALELARRIVELAEDKKAADIVLLDLTPLTTIADYFVICSGGSERQLDAIADGIVSPLRDERTKPIGREGTPASHWVLLDFGSVIVHIFTPPERDYYGLEKHWSEARTVLRVQ
jgi:ribosome-associated protein